MSWKKKIPGCFGAADRVFAGHVLDKERARKMLEDAAASGASIDDVAQEADRFLDGEGCSQQHRSEQEQRVRDPISYF